MSIADYAKYKSSKLNSNSKVVHNDPECVIYCNSQFHLIEEWLQQARLKVDEAD